MHDYDGEDTSKELPQLPPSAFRLTIEWSDNVSTRFQESKQYSRLWRFGYGHTYSDVLEENEKVAFAVGTSRNNFNAFAVCEDGSKIDLVPEIQLFVPEKEWRFVMAYNGTDRVTFELTDEVIPDKIFTADEQEKKPFKGKVPVNDNRGYFLHIWSAYDPAGPQDNGHKLDEDLDGLVFKTIKVESA